MISAWDVRIDAQCPERSHQRRLSLAEVFCGRTRCTVDRRCDLFVARFPWDLVVTECECGVDRCQIRSSLGPPTEDDAVSSL